MLAALPQLGLQQLVDMDFTVFRQFFEYLFLHINSHWCLFRVIIRFSIPGLSTFVRVFYKCAVSSNKKISVSQIACHLHLALTKGEFGRRNSAQHFTLWHPDCNETTVPLTGWASSCTGQRWAETVFIASALTTEGSAVDQEDPMLACLTGEQIHPGH